MKILTVALGSMLVGAGFLSVAQAQVYPEYPVSPQGSSSGSVSVSGPGGYAQYQGFQYPAPQQPAIVPQQAVVAPQQPPPGAPFYYSFSPSLNPAGCFFDPCVGRAAGQCGGQLVPVECENLVCNRGSCLYAQTVSPVQGQPVVPTTGVVPIQPVGGVQPIVPIANPQPLPQGPYCRYPGVL